MTGAGAAILNHKVVLELKATYGTARRRRSLSVWELCGAALSCLAPDFYLTQKYIAALMKGFCFGFLFLSAKPNSNRSINRSWLTSFSALPLPGPTSLVVFKFNVTDTFVSSSPSGGSLEEWMFVRQREQTWEGPGWPGSQPLWSAWAISGRKGRVRAAAAVSGCLAPSQVPLYLRCFRCEIFQWTKVLIPCLHVCFYGIFINVALTKK